MSLPWFLAAFQWIQIPHLVLSCTEPHSDLISTTQPLLPLTSSRHMAHGRSGSFPSSSEQEAGLLLPGWFRLVSHQQDMAFQASFPAGGSVFRGFGAFLHRGTSLYPRLVEPTGRSGGCMSSVPSHAAASVKTRSRRAASSPTSMPCTCCSRVFATQAIWKLANSCTPSPPSALASNDACPVKTPNQLLYTGWSLFSVRVILQLPRLILLTFSGLLSGDSISD